MRATPETLEDQRVRLEIEVEADEVDEAVSTTARTLARQLRVPGFRPGRAPRQVIEARLGGPKALRAEALRDLLPEYYARAVSATELEPISPPELNLKSGGDEGSVSFDAVVEVRPELQVVGYDALRVTIPSPLPTDAELEQLLEQLREPDAELRPVERPIVTGDYVTMDVRATRSDGTEVDPIDDYVYLVGQGTLVDTVDQQLSGMRAGETLETSGNAPGGAEVALVLTLKEVRERVLPELTDEWVRENTQAQSAQELRDRSMEQIRASKLARSRRVLRDATFAALAGLIADDEVPETMLAMEFEERAEDFERSLAASKVTKEQYLAAMRLTEQDLAEMLHSDARHAIKVDLALRAVAAAEGLDPTPEELDEELARLAQLRKQRPEQLREELVANGRTGVLRSGVAKSKAADWVLERVVYVDEAGATIDRSLLEDDTEDDTAGGAAPEGDAPSDGDEGTARAAEELDQSTASGPASEETT